MAEPDLDGDQQRGQPQPPVEHHAALRTVDAAQQVPRAGRGDAHRARQERGQQHVRPAHQHHRAEHDGHPVAGHDPPVDDLVAHGDLHPGIVREDPEGRGHGAERDHAAGEEIEARGDPVAPEQHDAEEARFEQEGGEGLVAQKRSLDRAGLLRQHAPVGAELEGHDDAGDHAHREGDGEDLQPEVEDAPVDRVAGEKPHALDGREPGRQPDREGGKDDVEGHDEGELDARQDDRVQLHSRPSRPTGSRIATGGEFRGRTGVGQAAETPLHAGPIFRTSAAGSPDPSLVRAGPDGGSGAGDAASYRTVQGRGVVFRLGSGRQAAIVRKRAGAVSHSGTEGKPLI